MTPGEANLEAMFERADQTDRNEGELAYGRYHRMMVALAQRFELPLEQVTAVFVALSPNNDYDGNLRSAVSVCHGFKNNIPCERVTVSTYKHCRDRAYSYLTGTGDFLRDSKGMKIRSFWHNLVYPNDPRWVTIDGHMMAAWLGNDSLTMKQAIVRRGRDYLEIADAVKLLAFKRFLIPNQYQATIWFARKRSLGIKYNPQPSLFHDPTDKWQTYRDIAGIEPYPTA